MESWIQWVIGTVITVLMMALGGLTSALMALYRREGQTRERLVAVETDLRGMKTDMDDIKRTVHQQSAKVEHIAETLRDGINTLRDRQDSARDTILSEIAKIKIEAAKNHKGEA